MEILEIRRWEGKADITYGMGGFLNTKEKAILKEMHLSERGKRMADRIKTILLLDKGHPYEQIAEILLLDDSTIRRYENIYWEGGLDNLLEMNYKGYDGKLIEKQEEELKQHLRENLMRSAKEVADWIKQKWRIEYTPQGLVHLLHRLGFVYKKTRPVPAKANKEKQEAFLKEYEKIKGELGEKDKVYFMDGVHAQHNSMPAYGWIEKGKEKKIPSNTGRKRININGALNIGGEEPELIFREDETINAQSTIELFKQIEEKNPEAEKIVVISDNAKYYRAVMVKEFLATSKIEIEFLPSYSPNLNLIERLWKFFKEKVARGKYYEKFAEFHKKTIDFFVNICQYKDELKSLLTENFQIIGWDTS